MASDKYSAVWVSHTSMSDFLKCPRAYYLKNMYKDPKTRHKIQLMSSPLALGQVVHSVIERLSVLPVQTRFATSLLDTFELEWKKVTGKRGGFLDPAFEEQTKERGRAMLRKVMENPGPLRNLALKLDGDLPQFWLSEQDNIMLSGKIDWLEYLPESDSVHIIDFKTSKSEEDAESLQLPIYHLLVHYCQQRKVSKVSYWYLALQDTLKEQVLPDLEDAQVKVLKIAKKIKLARQLNKLDCPTQGCRDCEPYEKILRGEAEFVGVSEYKQDVYIMPSSTTQRTAGTIL